MRVKLCARCPYSPLDLADLYDARSSSHLCVRCDGKAAAAEKLTILMATNGEAKCATATNASNTASQARPAPSAAESLV